MQCTEEFDVFELEPALARARLIGRERLLREQAICADWPRSRLPDGFYAPVRSWCRC